MRKYTIFETNGAPDWSAVPVISVDCVLWEPDCGIRMAQQLCYDETALYVRQRAKESAIRAGVYCAAQPCPSGQLHGILLRARRGQPVF